MTTKYTPGPWHVTDATWDDEGNVRYTLTGIKSAKIADARLIAAAPELLEALQAMLENCYDLEKDDDTISAVAEARAAIAKATGEQE